MFDDIRPYRDDEVAAVIEKLINEKGVTSLNSELKAAKVTSTFPKRSLHHR